MTRPRARAPALSESAIQRAVFEHLRARAWPRVFAFHPKNASSDMRGRRRGVYAGLGVVPGVPDVIIVHAGRTFALELKADRGKLTAVQSEAMAMMTHAGVTCAVVWGLDAALEQLERWGVIRGTVG